MLDNKSILITGGTGSYEKKFTKRVLEQFDPKNNYHLPVRRI